MKTYYLKFGSGNPANFTALAPTFTVFNANGVTALAAPGITETPAGSGLYSFMYAPTLSILFLADGGSNLANTDRFLTGALDPIHAVDEKMGYTTDSFGTTLVDPSTVLGYLKRNQEFQEGDSTFTKATGVWDISTRGSSTLLREKHLTNTTTSATKTGQ